MKRYNKRIYLLFLFVFVFEGCEVSSPGNENQLPPDNHDKVTIQQGVWGNVWFWEGDFMPSTDNSSKGKITAVERDIYVYEPTSLNMVKNSNQEEGTFYSEVNSKLISVIRSDANGFFQISLEPGKYSFFIKENSLFYANGGDGEGYIQSGIVTKGEVTEMPINITYKAAY